jgi:hypothetical protein
MDTAATPEPEDSASPQADLIELSRIILFRVTFGKYTSRLRKGKTRAPWYSLPRGRRSFSTAHFFNLHGTIPNLVEVVTAGRVTIAQLEEFLQRSRLSTLNHGRVENAINRLKKLREDGELAEAKAQIAAEHSTGTGVTGELSAIIADATASSADSTAPTGRRRLRRLARSSQ